MVLRTILSVLLNPQLYVLPQDIQPWWTATSFELAAHIGHLLSKGPQSGLGQLLEREAARPGRHALDGDPALGQRSSTRGRDVD